MRCLRAVLAGAVLLSFLGEASAGDWPQWRGPARDGVADASGLPAKWPAALGRVWARRVGEDHSSPVVRGRPGLHLAGKPAGV